MDRCALFVDAGYMLADGATAVHGTSSRDSVSWDYAGLLRFLASLSADRTGQQLLRCYWYEATVDGRRTSEHDTLADLSGLTLRLGQVRPGQREGVEADIHRDLTTLATNRAVSDVLLVSAGEDLAQVIADVQGLGIRVMIVHISVDGNWTISRSLRQQCDDVVQIDGTQLRPYVELIVGAEPARYDEPYAVGAYGGKPLANGHAASAGGSGMHRSHAAGESPLPPAPQPFSGPQPLSGPQLSAQASSTQISVPQTGQAQQGQAQTGQGQNGQGQNGQPQTGERQTGEAHTGQRQAGEPRTGEPRTGRSQISRPGPPQYPKSDPGSLRDPLEPAPAASSARPDPPAAPPALDRPTAQYGAPASAPVQAHPGPASDPLPPARGSGQAAAGPSAAAPPPAPGRRAAGPRPPYAPSNPDSSVDPAVGRVTSAPPEQFTSGPPNLPARRGASANGRHGDGPHADSPHGDGRYGDGSYSDSRYGDSSYSDGRYGDGSYSDSRYGDSSYSDGRYGDGRHRNGVPVPQGQRSPRPQLESRDHQAARAVPAGPDYIPQQGSYDARLPVPSTAGRAPASGSLADTVATAHSEGFEFGESVARDAPGLWLEAVLARKPRMPSDLEARLLQGSALPIDALLHDEVRHALRRGFWDALERSRR